VAVDYQGGLGQLEPLIRANLNRLAHWGLERERKADQRH
jgi:hypothetical protein